MPSAVHSIKTKKCYGRLHKAKERFGALLPQRLPTLVPCLDLAYFDPKVNPLLVWLLGYISTLSCPRNTYLLIRDLYDVDNVGFGPAIGLYIRQFAWWSKQHNWPGIISYTNPRMTQAIGTMSTFSYSRATAHMTHGTFWQIIQYEEPSLRSVAIHLSQLE